MMMFLSRWLLVVVILCCLLGAQTASAQVTEADIKASVAKAAAYLRDVKDSDSSRAALVAYALIAAGDDPGSPAVKLVLDNVAKRAGSGNYKPGSDGIYGAGVEMMLLEAADPRKYRKEMQGIVDYLVKHQHSSGAWDYVGGFRGGDTSQCQYAMLGLWAAQRAGLEVDPAVVEKGAQWFLRVQLKDGGFGYHPLETHTAKNVAPLHTMTAAGSGSLAIARLMLYPNEKDPSAQPKKKAPTVKFGVLQSVDLDTVENPDGTKAPNPNDFKPTVASGALWGGATRSAGWIAQRYTLTTRFNLYYLYSLERMAALLNIQTLAGHDWYREGAAYLIKTQSKAGAWRSDSGEVASTALGVLFLMRATAKILKRDVPFDPLGGGLLAGGRGLPDDLNQAILKDGKVESTKELGPLDSLLAELDKIESVDVAAAQEEIVRKVHLGDREELIKQKDRLVKLAGHSNVDVKRTALWALGRTEDLRLAKILVDALDDNDVDVMVEARNALCVMSRKPLGFGIKESPFEGLPDNLSQAEKDAAVAEWREELKEKWVAWYHRVRPYDERDDLSEIALEAK